MCSRQPSHTQECNAMHAHSPVQSHCLSLQEPCEAQPAKHLQIPLACQAETCLDATTLAQALRVQISQVRLQSVAGCCCTGCCSAGSLPCQACWLWQAAAAQAAVQLAVCHVKLAGCVHASVPCACVLASVLRVSSGASLVWYAAQAKPRPLESQVSVTIQDAKTRQQAQVRGRRQTCHMPFCSRKREDTCPFC